MADISCNNPFAFDANTHKISPRDMLEGFCKAKYPDQTIVFLCGIDVDPLPGEDNSFQSADAELYEWFRQLRYAGNVHWDIGYNIIPVIVRDCSNKLADRLRAVVYDRNITALWHNNALDYFTD